MSIIICPGIHTPELSDRLIQIIEDKFPQRQYLVLPTEQYPPYSAIAIGQWLHQYYPSPRQTPPLSFLTFSAGVVGAIGAAITWQLRGGRIQSFVAFDGWGMPLAGNFPIYRVSHDYFTHWSSHLLGGGNKSYYAAPAVKHLELWRSPDTCWGWKVISPGLKTRFTLINYLENVLDS